jgi:hypothetical protein
MIIRRAHELIRCHINCLDACFFVIPAKAGIQNALRVSEKSFILTAGAVSGWSGQAGPYVVNPFSMAAGFFLARIKTKIHFSLFLVKSKQLFQAAC